MTKLIDTLRDIIANEEFSPEQRVELVKIAMEDAAKKQPTPADINIDAALGRHLTKETLPNGGIRFGLASHLPTD